MRTSLLVVILGIAFFLIDLSHAWILASVAPLTRPPVPDNVRILVLPGFGNDESDYFLEQAPQGSLVLSLQSRGWKKDQIKVLPLKRSDWLNVFLRGVFDLQFWLATAPPTKPFFAWYLERVAQCIEELSEDGSDVVLVCHSAGGWLARAALGFGSLESEPNVGFQSCVSLSKVLGIVTLGAPHFPPPPEIMDMTRGALRITNEQFPGAFHGKDGLFYVTVMGNAVKGVKQERTSPLEPTTTEGFAFNSYETVCGVGETSGDGVVPVSAGHLDDAIRVDLEGVYHSINAPDRWYGSENILDMWHSTMLQEIARVRRGGSVSRNPLDGIFRKA